MNLIECILAYAECVAKYGRTKADSRLMDLGISTHLAKHIKHTVNDQGKIVGATGKQYFCYPINEKD